MVQKMGKSMLRSILTRTAYSHPRSSAPGRISSRNHPSESSGHVKGLTSSALTGHIQRSRGCTPGAACFTPAAAERVPRATVYDTKTTVPPCSKTWGQLLWGFLSLPGWRVTLQSGIWDTAPCTEGFWGTVAWLQISNMLKRSVTACLLTLQATQLLTQGLTGGMGMGCVQVQSPDS